MTEDNTLRKRNRQDTQVQNGHLKRTKEEKTVQDLEFVPRQSPLTVLFDSSLHIKALYHIFIVILLVLLCDIMTFDLVDRGKINVGINTVIHGFGDISRGARLWLYEFLVTLAFYPCLRTYAAIGRCLVKYPGLSSLWAVQGLLGLSVTLIALCAYPIWDLKREHLALGSSASVTCEMFRFAMKIYAVAAACAPRCRDDDTALPSFRHYLYFLFAPTLVYRDKYPRTKNTRWDVVVRHFVEVAAVIFYNSFLWERFILPYWSDYGKKPKVEAGVVIRGMFACVLPGVISFLCAFYLLLHAWMNAFAEMLTFADRLFYEEWWTSSQFSRYYRAWNRVVHSWLRDHIYRPLAPSTGRAIATLTVFLISAIAHEVILALSFGFFYPVLLMEFGGFGLLMIPLTAATGRRYPSVLNLLMWLSFFIGNGILWSLYPMEYFARKNCPPDASDSFFIPKSWSCPEIVLKPNWTFQNPFEIDWNVS